LQKDPSDRPDLLEIKRLLPKEATPSKKPESTSNPSAEQIDDFTAPASNPTPRINPFPTLLAIIAAAWIGFGTEWTGVQKAGAIFLIFTAAIGLTLAKRRNRY